MTVCDDCGHAKYYDFCEILWNPTDEHHCHLRADWSMFDVGEK